MRICTPKSGHQGGGPCSCGFTLVLTVRIYILAHSITASSVSGNDTGGIHVFAPATDMAVIRTLQLLVPFASSAALAGAVGNGIDYRNLPTSPVFPGPWDHYIKAPANQSFITPREIWKVEGNVTTPSSGATPIAGQRPGHESILIGAGGLLSLAFDENISGRSVSAHKPSVGTVQID